MFKPQLLCRVVLLGRVVLSDAVVLSDVVLCLVFSLFTRVPSTPPSTLWSGRARESHCHLQHDMGSSSWPELPNGPAHVVNVTEDGGAPGSPACS